MPSPSFRGVWTALVTPFRADGNIDLEAFERILRIQIEAKVAGVIPCGTTGESPTLTRDERRALLTAALRATRGTSVQVVAGTGTNDTRETIELSREAESMGASGCLVVTPYYNKPSQAGLIAHYQAVAESTGIPVILYNVPGRTSVSLSAETVATLAAHPRIVAIKEATGSLPLQSEIMEKLRATGRDLLLISGDDATYFPFLAQGGHGIISVASNLFPRAMVELQTAAERGEWPKAKAIHERYFPLFRDLFVESNPIPIKYALARAGVCGAGLRLPLTPLSPQSAERLEMSLNACGIEKGRIPA